MVVKLLKPVKSRKYKREILVLQHVRGGPNIIEHFGAFIEPHINEPALVFERIENDNWKELYPCLSYEDVRHYTYQLLLALDFVHSKGIIHRDVKPHNIMIDHSKRLLRLIDFGLADFYHPHRDYNLRVASRYYKPPEILLGYRRYDYSFDMWSFGCLLAGMIFRMEVLFRGDDDLDQLRCILQLLGGPDLRAYVRRYGMKLDPPVARMVESVKFERQPLYDLVGWDNGHLARGPAVELVERVLVYDHRERWTAREALGCAFYEGMTPDTPQ
ncbi:Casein kinase II subunit alpha, partial [Borealophlyctis nickersoniae]